MNLEYYSATKRNEALTHATTQWTLKKYGKAKTTYCVLLFIWNVWNRQIHGNQKYITSCHELEEGGWRGTANGHKVSLRDSKTILELMMMIAQLCEYTELYIFKRQILWYVKYISIRENYMVLNIFIKHCVWLSIHVLKI